jgi:hypothetical protein
MPAAEAQRLIDAKKLGQESLSTFVAERLESQEKSFWDRIAKLGIKTFSHLSTFSKMRTSDNRCAIATSDRDLFGRLLVVAQMRDVQLKEVLSHELSTVPHALA